jgi:hypothetical protein
VFFASLYATLKNKIGSYVSKITSKSEFFMQHLTIDETVTRLEHHGYHVTKLGDEYRSPCPAHKGKDPNLAFTLGKNEQVVFTCHSHHCSYEEIMNALGVEKTLEQSSPPKIKAAFGKTVHPTFERAVNAAGFGAGQQRQPDSVYRYNNADGSENFCIIRWNIEKDKIIRPVSKVGNGYIAGARTDGGYPIYRLPEIITYLKSCDKIARIYICEGEKATDTAVTVGLPATTSALGSNCATKTDWSILDKIATERNLKLEIVIFPDNDKPGQEYAESLVEIFTKFKSSPIVKIVPFADFGHVTGIETFPEHGDFYDLLELLDSKSIDEVRKMIDTMVESTLPETEIADVENNEVYLWHQFPVDILPATVSRFIYEVSAANGCDPAGVSIATLVVLATSIGNSRRLRLKRGWVFPAILWGMLIARKGTIKTWSMSPSIKPLDKRQAEYQQQYQVEKADYERKLAEYNRLTPAQRRQEPLPDLKEPILKRIVSREATEQKIVKNCAENPRGFCIFSDELTTLLRGMGQYCKDNRGGNAQSMFNSLFNGEGLESERVGESRYAPHAFVCIMGGIQPSLASKCFDQEAFESGFASRFIPVAPPMKIATWNNQVVSENTEQAYYRLIFAILALQMESVWEAANVDVSEWTPDGGSVVAVTGIPTEPMTQRPMLIETSPEALEVYREFFDRTANEMMELEDDNLRGTFEKLRTYAARIALVIHITRTVEQELFLNDNIDPAIAPWDKAESRIDELECDAESMRIAVTLADWFKYETRRVYATWGGLTDETPKPKGDGLQQRIVEFLEQKGNEVSLRDIQRRCKIDKATATTATESLLVQGLVERIEPKKSNCSPLFRLKST